MRPKITRRTLDYGPDVAAALHLLERSYPNASVAFRKGILLLAEVSGENVLGIEVHYTDGSIRKLVIL